MEPYSTSNAMPPGIFSGTGRFFHFGDPYDLDPKRIEFLGNERAGLFCHCRPADRLRLAIVGDHKCPHVRCVDGPAVHDPLRCVFYRSGKRPGLDERFVPGIFSAEASPELRREFREWARCAVSWAYTQAFLAGEGIVYISEFFRQITSFIQHNKTKLTNGWCAADAASHYGQSIYVGMSNSLYKPSQPVSADLPWPVPYKRGAGGAVEWLNPEATAELVREAHDAVSIYGHTIKGPYLLVLLQDAESDKVTDLYLIPVVAKEGKFATVDSDAERLAFRTHLDQACYKPLSLADLNCLPARYRGVGAEVVEFRYRPDLVSYEDRPVVSELCGFEQDEDYMRQFKTKRAYWRDLEHRGLIHYREIRLRDVGL